MGAVCFLWPFQVDLASRARALVLTREARLSLGWSWVRKEGGVAMTLAEMVVTGVVSLLSLLILAYFNRQQNK